MTFFLSVSPGRVMRACAAFGLTFALVVCHPLWAQSDSSSSSASGTSSTSSSGASTSTSAAPGSTSGVSGTGSAVATDGTMESPSSETRVPPPTSLQTGQPLWNAISPLRWSHLSLMSLTALGIYDTNTQSSQRTSGSEIGMLQGLMDFSIRRSRFAFDVQYQPSVWYTNGHLNKDWFGHIVDFQTAFAITPRDTLTLTDRFRYIPAFNPLTGQGFSANFSNFLLLENPFLTQGTTELINSLGTTWTHVVDASNHLTFHLNGEYVRLTEPPITPKPNIICIPGLPFCIIEPGPPPKGPVLQQQPTLTASGIWTHIFDARNSLDLTYSFNRSWLRGTYGRDAEYQTVSATYTRRLTETVTLTANAGPTFSASVTLTPPSPVHNATSFTGSLALFKTFKTGGVVLSAARSYGFAGQFSDSAHTSVNASVERQFSPHWSTQIGGSFIEQDFSNYPSTTGYMAWAFVNYNLSRSWSVFTSYHYLDTGGSVVGFAPRNSVSGGVRWSWAPTPSQ